MLLLLVFINVKLFSQEVEERINWYSFDEAVKLQEKNPKKIFMDIYTVWCGYCKEMDKDVFSNAIIAKYLNENFYPVKFNAEQKEDIVFKGNTYVNPNPDRPKSAHELAQAILQGNMVYPSFAFLNEEGLLITVVNGYFPAPLFEPILHYFGGDAFLSVDWESFSESFQSNIK